MKYKLFLAIVGLSIFSCKNPKDSNTASRTQVEVSTTKGTIVIELYNETPKHRDNFIKLVNERFYDSILWHRVINDFIIQTGDPRSKTAKQGDTLGSGTLGYYVPSEIRDTIFHKRGALSAAHDGNPELYSDGSHFVIIQKGAINPDDFDRMEDRINQNLSIYNAYHAASNVDLLEAAKTAYTQENEPLMLQFGDSIKNIAQAEKYKSEYKIPPKHKEYYKKYGGAPFNDRLYTVFGEVISGMSVVDSIALSSTDQNDRPLTDILITAMRIIERQD